MTRAFFPASFDPIHYGHIDIALRAREIFSEVVVGVYARPQKNILFSVEERIAMVRRALESPGSGISVVAYEELTVHFAEKIGAKVVVRGLRVFSDFELEFRMALANKRLNSGIDVVCLIANEQHMHLSSSTIREIASLGGDVSSMVPHYVASALIAKYQELANDGKSRHDLISIRD